MGFFKDFKDDFSKAVDELLSGNDGNSENLSDQTTNTPDSEETVDDNDQDVTNEQSDEFTEHDTDSANDITSERDTENAEDNKMKKEDDNKTGSGEGNMEENVDVELLSVLNSEEKNSKDEAGSKNNENEGKENRKKKDGHKESEGKVHAASLTEDDEVTIISKGTTIDGNITSQGSLEIMGNVTGDVECLGKLTITGKVIGNTTAAEVDVNTERLEGSITSEGGVKISLGTVLIGNITGTSAIIAGAVKGDIDINGPVVIDSSAIIKGNVKAKSLQINNGAVVEGFCSLPYSDINLDNIFE